MDIGLILNPNDSNLATAEGKRKRTAEVAGNECVEARETKRPRKGNDVLCKLCETVDFDAIFNPKSRKPQKLCSLKQMVQNAQCPLCILIISALHKETRRDVLELNADTSLLKAVRQILSDEDGRSSKEVVCTICFGLDTDLYLRRRDVAPLYHACVSFKLIGHRNRGKVLVSLDRVNPVVLSERSSESYITIRKPLSSAPFDPGTLHEWLMSSDKSLERKSSPRAAGVGNIGLKSLMDVGRFRLIDVKSGAVVVPSGDVRYAALSYVWGGKMAEYLPCADISSNLIQQSGYVDLQRTPKTIRDAAALLAAINEQYLWVDFHCIDQSDAEDIHANISSMSAIYENAQFTIIAAAGDDADAGLSRYSGIGGIDEIPTSIPQRGADLRLLPARKGLVKTLQRTKWASRAWRAVLLTIRAAFQERSLSRRCAIFTQNEVLFHSPEFEAREAYELVSNTTSVIVSDSGKTTLASRRGRDFNDILSAQKQMDALQYVDAVQQYSRRELTYPGDRLNAFTGILDKYYSKTKAFTSISDKYDPKKRTSYKVSPVQRQALSGMSMSGFGTFLFWDFNTTDSTPQKPIRIPQDTKQRMHFPSWSWVGWQGGIKFGKDFSFFEYDPYIIDSANITCNLTRAQSMLKWQPCLWPVEKPLRVTLHVSAYSIPCRLEPLQLPSGELDFRIWIAAIDMSELDDGTVLGKKICMADPDTALDHYLIFRDPYDTTSSLIVEGTGDLFRRLGLWNSGGQDVIYAGRRKRYFQLQ